MARKVGLYSRGVAAALKGSAMHAATKMATDAVADNVRAQGIRVGDADGGPREVDLPVMVTMTTTDRAHGNVTIAHPAGEAVQAKHGSLTKAAAQAGLDVRGRKK